jgi:protein-disulfide isomerase
MKPAVLALLAFVLPAAVQAAPSRQLPGHRVQRPPTADWTHVAALTPDGGIRIGNPDAKVKIVEYFSYTCPHCAAFATEAFDPLTRNYVRGGQVSYELRAALRDAVDLTVALAARCVAPQQHLAAVEAIMGAQQDWFPKAADYINAHRDALNGTDRTKAIHAMLASIGIEAMLVRQGMAPAAFDRCLDSKPAEALLQKTTDDAWNVKHISGTPGFFINDKPQPDIHGWAQLEPAIQAALKS